MAEPPETANGPSRRCEPHQGAKAPSRKLIDCFSTSPRTSSASAAISRITWGAPFVTRTRLSPVPEQWLPCVCVPNRKGWKCFIWYVSRACASFRRSDSQVDGILVFGPGSERRGEDHSSSRTPLTQNGSPSVSLFCVNVPVLSEQRTSIPANSSIAAKRVTIAFLRARVRAPTAIVTRAQRAWPREPQRSSIPARTAGSSYSVATNRPQRE